MMWKVAAAIVAALLIAGCLRTERMRPSENGVWIGVKDKSYDEVWKAANKVIGKRFKVTNADREMGTISATDNKWNFLWNEEVAFFVWPTDNSGVGYSVDVGSYVGSIWKENRQDWKKVIIEDLKKELGAS